MQLLSREKFLIVIEWWKAKQNDNGLIKEGEKRAKKINRVNYFLHNLRPHSLLVNLNKLNH